MGSILTLCPAEIWELCHHERGRMSFWGQPVVCHPNFLEVGSCLGNPWVNDLE